MLLLHNSNLIVDRSKRGETNSCKKPSQLHTSSPSSWIYGIVQIIVEAAQYVVNRSRSVAQLRYPETLLSSLVQASQGQRLRDSAHPSPRCMPRRRAAKIQPPNITTKFTRWKKERRGHGCFVSLFIDIFRTSYRREGSPLLTFLL